MKTGTLKLIFLFTLCFIQVASAQEKPRSEQKRPLICSDCLPMNGKALSLPIPEYPKAAKAVGASGKVGVQILINEEGEVVEAKPLSGYPLLWEASVKSALQAKFKPVLMHGKPIRVYGYIVYNYVSDSSPQINEATEKTSILKSAPPQIMFTQNISHKRKRNIPICNATATYLPTPAYPKLIKFKPAASVIYVQISIDANGKVTSAKAISGHLLLRPAAEKAALQAKFKNFGEIPAKVICLIVYKFRRD